MKKLVFLITLSLALFAFFSVNVFAVSPDNIKGDPDKKESVIHGKVIDKKTGEALAGVRVFVEGIEQVVYTDLDGNFELKNIKAGSYNISFNYISYKGSLLENIKLDPAKNKSLEITIE